MNILNVLQEQKKTCDGLQIKDDKTTAQATYVNYGDPAKIYALEGIYDHAKSLFGPMGGIYVNIYSAKGTAATKLSKSSDGHKYFNNLNFVDYFIETILASVREKTYYVAGTQGKTSRDGTTSLAVVSSAVSSDLLVNRIQHPEKFNIPTSITYTIMQAISYEFRKKVDAMKYLVYDNIKCDYVNDEAYAATCNAIATTVDRNPIIVEAYKRLMEECKEKGIDITASSTVSFPVNEVSGELGFNLRLDGGLRMYAKAFDENKASAFKDIKCPIFILDGFLGNQISSRFDGELETFIRNILITKDEKGFYKFSKYNPDKLDPPVFFFHRSNESTMALFDKISKEGITISLKDTQSGKTIDEKIAPRFIFLESEDLSQESYNTIKKIFSESVIDLDCIRRYIFEQARTLLTEETKVAQQNVPFDKEIEAVKLPVLIEYDKKTGNFTNLMVKYDPLKNEVRENSLLNEPPYYKQSNIFTNVATLSFDGSILFIQPTTNAHKERVATQKEIIQEELASYSPLSESYENAKRLTLMFNTATITPVFKTKTADEYEMMFDLYEDAHGIFQSVHVHGVLSGGNVTLFRIIDEVEENVMKTLSEGFRTIDGITERAIDKYLVFSKEVLNSIYRGYYRSYKDLLRTDHETAMKLVEQYKNEYKNEPITSYNIISDNFDRKVLESARTTVDTMQAALDVAQDMLNIKRVGIQKESEALLLERDFDPKSQIRISKELSAYIGELPKGE